MVAPIAPRRMFLPGLAVLLLLAGCGKKSTTAPQTASVTSLVASASVGSSFGELRTSEFPTGTTAGPSFTASDSFVTGSNLVISVSVPDSAVALLVGAAGRAGHYRIAVGPALTGALSASARKAAQDAALRGMPVAARLAGTSGLALVIATRPGEPVLPLVLGVEFAHSASQPAAHTLTASSRAAASDQLQVSLSWSSKNNVNVDLDLHVEAPVFADSSRDIYFGNRLDLGAILDLDSNAGCTIDDIRSENITWAGTTPPTGRYTVRVDLFSHCSNTRTDTLDYVVTIRQCGLARTQQGFMVADRDSAKGGTARSGRPIETFDFTPCTGGATHAAGGTMPAPWRRDPRRAGRR
jgi:hypothetical protein